ncbi:hypothetical protein MY10362_002831 [Beauveria mimosiformis]
MSTQAEHANHFAHLWTAECGGKDPGPGQKAMPWFKLRVGTALGRFIFKANRDDFLRCPRLLAGFDQHYAVLETYTRYDQDSDPLVDDCLAWIMPTLFTTLRDRGELFDPSERHRELSLKEFWKEPWRVFQVSAEQGCMRIEYCTTEASPNMSTWTDLPLPHLRHIRELREIQIVSWADVTVWHDKPRTIIGDQPRAVWKSGRQFYLKSFEGLDATRIARLIAKYEEIDAIVSQGSTLPQEETNTMLVPRTFYLVVDDEERALGLLQTYFRDGVPLREALQSGDGNGNPCSDATKRKWKFSLVKTLTQLHAVNITWASVDMDSVLVSGEDAWVFHFRDGYSAKEMRLAEAETPKRADIKSLSKLFQDELWGGTKLLRPSPAPDQPPMAELETWVRSKMQSVRRRMQF